MDPDERAEQDAASRRAERAELAELRRRAYGPGSDVDPADLERLRVLEAGPDARRRSPERADADGPRPSSAGPSSRAPSSRAPSSADAPEPEEEAAPPATRSLRRRTAAVWAASVLVAVGATVALTSVLDRGGREVGVVALDPDRAVPSRWDDWYRDAATGVGDFRGLTVIGLENPRDDSRCVVVASGPGRRGTPTGGCGAGSFPARALVTVDDDMPAELRDAFTEGTALEFVLDGGSVRVAAG